MIPGDPATAKLGTEATPAKGGGTAGGDGLKPSDSRAFAAWLGGLLQGDMGTSYSYSMPVTTLVSDKIPITLTLTLMSFAMMVLISIPLGLYTAKHEGGAADRIIVAAKPDDHGGAAFFSGILITLLFGLILRLFTPGGYVSYTKSIPGLCGLPLLPGAGHRPSQGGHDRKAATQLP